MVAAEENDYKKYGLIGTVAVHAGLAALFFLMVFTGPNPPLDAGGDGGIVLNYGVTGEEGFGDVQTMARANNSPNREDSRPAAKAPEPVPSEPVVQAQKTVDPTPEKIISGVDDVALPVKEKEIEKPKKAVEDPKPPVKAVEQPKSLYPGKSTVQTGGNGESGSSNQATGNNNGDRPGKVGDQGDPSGTLDSKALYGKPGTGGLGNGSLKMAGWAFDRAPKIEDNSNESGRIVFNIKVNTDGDIYYIAVHESNVSPALTKLYKDAVSKTTLSPTNSSGVAEVGASGTVTFIIRSR